MSLLVSSSVADCHQTRLYSSSAALSKRPTEPKKRRWVLLFLLLSFSLFPIFLSGVWIGISVLEFWWWAILFTIIKALSSQRESQQRIVRADPEHFSFDDGGMSLFSSLLKATAVTPRKEAFHWEAPNER